MKKSAMIRVAVSVCFSLGVIIWAAAPYVTGKRESLDPSSLYCPVSLFFAGFIGGAWVPPRFWLSALAVAAGHIFAFLWWSFWTDDRLGPLWPLGLIIGTLVWTLLSLFGAALGAPLGMLIRGLIYMRRKAQPSEPNADTTPRRLS
jgi:hypothetical protein